MKSSQLGTVSYDEQKQCHICGSIRYIGNIEHDNETTFDIMFQRSLYFPHILHSPLPTASSNNQNVVGSFNRLPAKGMFEKMLTLPKGDWRGCISTK